MGNVFSGINNPGLDFGQLTEAEAQIVRDLGALTFAEGDILYVNSDGELTNLAIGSENEILSVSAGGIPEWAAAGAGSGDFLADGSVPMTGDFDLDGNNIDNGGVIFLKEQAEADADVAGSGQIWVDTATPNLLMFTDDAGTDFRISTLTGTETLTNKTLTSPTVGTSLTGSYLTASEILITDGSKNIVSAPVATYPSLTELTYLKGVTSAIQTQLNAKGDMNDLSDDTSPTLGGALDAGGFDITNGGVIFLTEQAEAEADVAGKGQIWVDTATPNVLMFTDDAGTDFTIAHNATTALGSLGTVSTSLTGVLRADSGVLSADTDVTDLVTAASATAQGKVELATDAETVTGTDTERATTPANITAKMAAPGTIGGTTPGAATFTTVTGTTITNSVASVPDADDGATLGTSSLGWSDLFLAAGGNIKVANANAKRTIVLSAGSGAPLTTAGCSEPTKVEATTNDINYWVLDFDTTTEEHAFWSFVMPDNWDASTVTAKFVWTNAGGASAETVAWGIAGGCWGDDDAIDAALGAEITTTDTWIAQGDIHISAESSAITIANAAAGEWTNIVVARKTGSDTMAGDARLIQVRIEYGISAYSD